MKTKPNTYTVSFFGDRDVEEYDMGKVGEGLRRLVRKLLLTKKNVRFLVERRGDFDFFVTAAVHRVREELCCSNCSLVLVLPYITYEYRYNRTAFENCYDEIKIRGRSKLFGHKGAYQHCRRQMVNRSDLVVCFFRHKNDRAYKSVKYAEKKKIKICDIWKHFFK